MIVHTYLIYNVPGTVPRFAYVSAYLILTALGDCYHYRPHLQVGKVKQCVQGQTVVGAGIQGKRSGFRICALNDCALPFSFLGGATCDL